LAGVRGLDSRRAKGAAEAGLLDAVRAGLELNDGVLRQPPGEQIERRLRPVATLAGAWLAQRAAELRIDGPLLATRADLHALLRGGGGSRLASGWRRTLVGEPLRQLLAGEGALAVGSRGELVLEARSHRRAAPGNRGSGAVPAARVQLPTLGKVGVLEPELLARVDERRPPQREQEHGRGAGATLRAAVARAVAGRVVVGQHPRGPRAPR